VPPAEAVLICPSCGEENPDRFRLCGFCGTPLAASVPTQDVRRTVTIVFCDLVGSTDLGETLDSEALRGVLHAYFTEMTTVLERHGGLVEKYIGDAIMAVFGMPRAHDDDALRAVRAAHEMQVAMVELNQRLESLWGVTLQHRSGVSTGEVVAGDPNARQRLVTGDAVNLAARLEQAASPMQILIGQATYRLVKDAVEVEPVEPLQLKGKSELIQAYRVLQVNPAGGVGRRTDTPMVGRSAELSSLLQALARVARIGGPELVTVLAPAGMGKSRLLHEFARKVETPARLLRGRCLSYGEGITFWPLIEIARDAAGIATDDSVDEARRRLGALLGPGAADAAERVASVIGLSEESYPVQETFWAARRLLEVVAANGPLVTMIDDIHWAEPTFLDLLSYLTDAISDALILLVCSSRPELLEHRPAWGEERAKAEVLTLSALTETESVEVVSNLLGAGALDGGTRRRIIEAAQGNPLFVEQMLSMLIDDGLVARDDLGHWAATSSLAGIAIPPTISALLAARLDRLSYPERTALERGSVIGQTFYTDALKHLCPDSLRPEVPEILGSLSGKELISSAESTLADLQAFQFLHLLIRDAAYSGLLKRSRAELHEKFVDWMGGLTNNPGIEYEEILGYHLEQAFLIRAQLAPIDRHGTEVGQRGAGYLASAGDRARARGDMPAAAGLLRRSAALLPVAAPARPTLLLHAGEALGEMGDFQQADAVLAQSSDAADLCGDRAVATTASVVRMMWHHLAAPESMEVQRVVDDATTAIADLEVLEAHAGLARAWRLMTHVHFYEGLFGPAEESGSRAIQEAELAGDRVLEVRLLSSLASCALYSPTPAAEAVERCNQVIERSGGDRRTEAVTLCSLSGLEAMRGDASRAREYYQRSRSMLNELGFSFSAALTSLISGPAEMLAGDLPRAEAELRGDYETLLAMGEKGYMSSVAGLLAEVLYAQGRHDEAAHFASVCQQTAAPYDVGAQYQWRCVQAKLLAGRGWTEEAEALAREGVRLIKTTDQPAIQADGLMSLAVVLEHAGKTDEAAASLHEAISLFEQKGDIVSAARGRAALSTIVDRANLLAN
jgi:class 3 adenylate cyclase/tetratricopeptide (TPR) repeat protein